MATSPEPRAGGAIIALTTVAGAVLGVIAGQPTLGLLAGLALGGMVATAIWLRDRRH